MVFHLLVFVFFQFTNLLFNDLVVFCLYVGLVGLSIDLLFLFKIQSFTFNYYSDLISSVQKK